MDEFLQGYMDIEQSLGMPESNVLAVSSALRIVGALEAFVDARDDAGPIHVLVEHLHGYSLQVAESEGAYPVHSGGASEVVSRASSAADSGEDDFLSGAAVEAVGIAEIAFNYASDDGILLSQVLSAAQDWVDNWVEGEIDESSSLVLADEDSRVVGHRKSIYRDASILNGKPGNGDSGAEDMKNIVVRAWGESSEYRSWIAEYLH